MALDFEANPLALIIDIERNGFDSNNEDHVNGVRFLVETKIIDGLEGRSWRHLSALFEVPEGRPPTIH